MNISKIVDIFFWQTKYQFHPLMFWNVKEISDAVFRELIGMLQSEKIAPGHSVKWNLNLFKPITVAYANDALKVLQRHETRPSDLFCNNDDSIALAALINL